jgi:IS5 family transposase
VGEAAPSSSRPSRRSRPDRLGACLTRFGFHPGQKGGPKTGANPTDKGKKGTKRHLVSDRKGVPLAVALTAANVHDSMVFEELIDALGPIKGPGRGRPSKRPEKLHADKAYDDKKCKGALRRRGIKSRIARKGIERAPRNWVGTGGLWSARWPGFRSTAGSRSATSGARTSMRRFSILVAR